MLYFPKQWRIMRIRPFWFVYMFSGGAKAMLNENRSCAWCCIQKPLDPPTLLLKDYHPRAASQGQTCDLDFQDVTFKVIYLTLEIQSILNPLIVKVIYLSLELRSCILNHWLTRSYICPWNCEVGDTSGCQGHLFDLGSPSCTLDLGLPRSYTWPWVVIGGM